MGKIIVPRIPGVRQHGQVDLFSLPPGATVKVGFMDNYLNNHSGVREKLEAAQRKLSAMNGAPARLLILTKRRRSEMTNENQQIAEKNTAKAEKIIDARIKDEKLTESERTNESIKHIA
jgi:hypothetical protein